LEGTRIFATSFLKSPRRFPVLIFLTIEIATGVKDTASLKT